jgi:hypothetical protein
MKVAYVKHPVSKDEKKAYLKEFDKVQDIKFAPEKLEAGSKVFDKKGAEAATAADIVKLIKSAESFDLIKDYAEDDRKTVKEAYEVKVEELSAK